MGWDDAPPTAEEVKTLGSGWASAPPTDAELKMAGVKPKVGVGESLLKGSQQGLTLGFADELGGKIQEGLDYLAGDRSPTAVNNRLKEQGFKGDVGPTSGSELYRDARDKNREDFKNAQEANPKAFLVGNIAGAALPALLTGGGSAAATGTEAAAKATPLLTKIGMGALKGAGQGLATGAVYGLGNSESEDIGGMARDTATGGVVGGLTGGLIGGAAPALGAGAKWIGNKISNSVVPALEDQAEILSAKAQGATKPDFRNMSRIKNIGRTGLDEGVVTPLASSDDMLDRALALKNEGGAQMGDVYNQIDSKGASSFNPMDVASKVDAELSPAYRTPINKGETTQLDNTLESILQRGDKNISMRDAQALKEEIGSVAFPKGKMPVDPTPKQQMAIDAYHIVNSAIDDAAQAGSESIGTAGLKDQLARGKSLYGYGQDASKLLTNKIAGEQATAGGLGRYLDPTKTVQNIYKDTVGKYGNQTGAYITDKVANVAAKVPQALDDTANVIGKTPPNAAIPATIALQPQVPAGRFVAGEEKWANDGIKKLGISDQDTINQILGSKEGRTLLIQASDLDPNSQAFKNIKDKIQKGWGVK